MKFDKLKPNLQELNLNGVKKAASRVAHVRIRLSRGQWIGVIAGLVVVTVSVSYTHLTLPTIYSV